jgi:PAS domain S-box-containing protein
VDDDRDFLDLVQAHLSRLPDPIVYETTTDPEEALARVSADDTTVGAVVTDFDMPGTNGLDLLRAIRAEDERLPVVLYTGRGSEEVAAEAISEGVTDYIQKGHGSAHVQVLSNVLRNAIDGAEAERRAELRLAALEAVREGIAIFSPAGELVYANAAHQRLYDYSLDEALGRSWTAFHPARDLGTIRAEVLPALDVDGEWEGPGTGVRQDGTEFAESKSITGLPDGGFAVVVVDADRGAAGQA